MVKTRASSDIHTPLDSVVEHVICDCMEFAELCDSSFVLFCFFVRVVTTFSDWTWKNVFW